MALSLAALSLVALAGCSAGEGGDDSDSDTVGMFNVPNNTGTAGAGGAANPAPSNNPGNTTTQPQGNGGSSAEVPGSNVNNVVPPNNMQMPGNGAAGTGNGAAGTGNGAAGAGNVMGSAGAGGAGNNPPPPPPAGVGRVGVENCPAGPFGAPLPANPQVSKIFSVGENNFFNFEGAVWVGNSLYFSEIGNGAAPPPSRINRYTPPGNTFERGVFANTGSNGLGVDAQGNLIATNHKDGRISIIELPSGTTRDYGATTFNNARFNSPNDLVQRADGNVYFTDPSFQAPNPNPQNGTRVYRIPPQGAATLVDGTLSNPNGITLSPDGSRLYVTSASGFRRYDLAADGTPGPAITINLQDGLQTPDGMTADCAGNIYTIEHQRRLIRVFDRDGVELGRFGGTGTFDNDVTNMAFGGADRRTLFVTTLTQADRGGVFQVQLNIPGFPY
jgi:gluconolactonase